MELPLRQGGGLLAALEASDIGGREGEGPERYRRPGPTRRRMAQVDSVFEPSSQHGDVDKKIVASPERTSRASAGCSGNGLTKIPDLLVR